MRFPDDVPVLTDSIDTRLRLRAHTAADVEPAYRMCLDPEFQRWTTIPVPYERRHAEDYVLDKIPAGWREGGMWAWAIEWDGEFAGTIDLRDGRGQGGEVGFGAAPWARGQGVMTRATKLVVRHAFDVFGWDLVIWRAFVGNWGSRRVAWKAGFRDLVTARLDGISRGVRHNEWIASVRAGEKLEPQGRWLDIPVIEEETFRLRPLSDDDDVDRVVEATSDPRTYHWLAHLPLPYSPDDARTWFGQVRENAAAGEGVSWAIADPVSDVLLGNVSVFRLGNDTGNEVGYWMHPDARGKGLATAAVRRAVRHAFRELGCHRLFLRASAGNAASRHVAEQAGFRHVGTDRSANELRDGTFEDLLIFDLLDTDKAVVESAG
jgi:RimJ/RimL family protein N-acetyltransferase